MPANDNNNNIDLLSPFWAALMTTQTNQTTQNNDHKADDSLNQRKRKIEPKNECCRL